MANANSTFTIGITGHRDLVDSELKEIKATLQQQFEAFKARLPNTEQVLICGMADGADMLVAETALDCGYSVEALLPMPMASYEKDFSDAALIRLKDLIQHEKVNLKVTAYANTLQSDDYEQQEIRNQCYSELGNELIDKSILLLCLWDGKNVAKQGGTSDVVLRYLNLGRYDDGIEDIHFTDHIEPDEPANDKAVLWLPVNRQSNEQVISYSSEPKVLLASYDAHRFILQEEFTEQFIDQLKHLNNYNREYNEMSEADKNVYDNRLTASIEWNSEERMDLIGDLDRAFVKADNHAMFHQKFSNKQFKLFAYMAAFMGIFFLIYAKIISAKIFIILYVLLFVLGLFIYKKTEKKHYFTSHLTSRIIAETLRVKVFLSLAGIERRIPIEKLLGLSGVNQFAGFNWIKLIFKPINFNNRKQSPELEQFALDYIIEHWIEDQALYFNKKSKQLAEQHHQLEKVKNALLAGSFFAALALIFFKTMLVNMVIAGDFTTKTLLVFLMGLLPFLLGVWEIYQGKMAIKELNWQYRNQGSLFNTSLTKLKHAKSIQEKKDIIFKLAENSLMECYLWSIHRYHREHEPPSAG